MEALFNPSSLVSAVSAQRKALVLLVFLLRWPEGRRCLYLFFFFLKGSVRSAFICACVYGCASNTSVCRHFVQQLYNDHMMTGHLAIKCNPDDSVMERLDLCSSSATQLYSWENIYKICTSLLSWPKKTVKLSIKFILNIKCMSLLEKGSHSVNS